MKRYWDHSETDRAKLTAEQIEKLLAYELMEQGVLQVEPLKLEEEMTVETTKRRVFLLREGNDYGTVLNIGFETIEAAETARAAIRFIVEKPWNAPAHTRPVKPLQVTADDLTTDEEIARNRVSIDEQRRREAANAQAKREYEEASKKVSEATSGIWTDWRECQVTEARRQKIRDTLADYLRMTDGNETLARAFLAKAFPAEEIAEACPTLRPDAAETMESPGPVASGDQPTR